MGYRHFFLIFCSFSLLSACGSSHKQYNKRTAGKFPIYGNWCGPDHPVDTSKAPTPIDHLDASCQVHDLCYEEKGYFDCGCDAQLTASIRLGLEQGVYKGSERHMARTVHNYFKASPCNGDTKDKVAPTRVLQKAYKSGEEAAINIWNKFADEDETTK
ncbi:MAG: hypothetical protein OEZ68_09215 [Gammaproteobacteria bacterium]|nr:hypothetical protein [Gammaproteobacteria bacterium]MDH5800967.1 hypothetical protein [Gammaproteobacteria bacterium]